MSHDEYNPNDPLFLLSRYLDGDLTPQERTEIESRIAASPELQAELSGMRQAESIVRRATGGPVELDWDAQAEAIKKNLVENADGDAALDALLTRWGSTTPDMDEGRFVADVRARLQQPVRRRNPIIRIFGYAAPLAAAAAIAIVATLGIRPTTPTTEVSIVSVVEIGPGSTTETRFRSTSAAVVAFDRTAGAAPRSPGGRIGMTVVSAGDARVAYGVDSPPI
ncbi:MAG: hypothetical protein J5J06_14310 [Phycisphaerae bacterium]|nr:hypothetical protein [Phycisphaerae bacterium]